MERTFALSLVMAFPLGASLVALLLGRLARNWLGQERGKITIVYASLFGTSMPLFFLAQALFAVVLQPSVPALVEQNAPWFSGEFVTIERHLRLDALSGLLAFGVGVVSTLVGVFGVAWAAERDDGHYFFAWVGAIEAASMLMLMAESTVLFVAAWYVIGLLAFLGIGWRKDPRAAASASRYLQAELFGSAALLLALLGLVSQVHSFDFELLRLSAVAGHDSLFRQEGPFGAPLAESVGLAFLVAAAVRLGAFPLHAALDATRNAPRPVSALLYGGVFAVGPAYLFVRLDPVIALAPTSMAIMVVLGAVAALVGGVGALVARRDSAGLRSLAVGVHGLAFLALGMGAWPVAVLLVLAHGPALAALGLACATAHRHGGETSRPRLSLGVRRAAIVAAASLGALVPSGGLAVAGGVAAGGLTHLSAWSPGLNYLAFVAALLSSGFLGAAAFRLVLHFDVDAEPADRDAAGMHVLAVGSLAALSILAAALALPEAFAWPNRLAFWMEPLTRISMGFHGANADFAVGPASSWSGEGGSFVGVRWACLAAAWVSGLVGMAWSRRRSFDASPPRLLDRVAGVGTRLVRVEQSVWRGIGRILDFLGLVARLGIDEIAAERGSIALGSAVADAGRRLRVLGRYRIRHAAIGIVVGVVFVLGWIYFKPRVATLAPGLHGFGGLRPALQSPARAERRLLEAEAPAAASEVPDVELGAPEEQEGAGQSPEAEVHP